MNKADALAMIKAKMGGDDTDLKNSMAETALDAAIGHISLLGEYRWNQQSVGMVLTSGNSKWTLAQLIPLHKVRKIYDEGLWDTNAQNYIEVVELELFNKYRRGQTSSGTPVYATVHSANGILEVYPTPTSDMTVWCTVGILPTDIEQLPEELHMAVINLAVIGAVESDSPAYIPAVNMWNESKMVLDSTKSYLVWNRGNIKGDRYMPGSKRSGLNEVDSYNPFAQ